MLLPRYKPFRRNKTISEEARLTFNVHCIKHRLVNENVSHGIQEISSDTNISCSKRDCGVFDKDYKEKGKEKEELDAIERMLALNVCNKEKSEYVKVWKQLMDECKKKK